MLVGCHDISLKSNLVQTSPCLLTTSTSWSLTEVLDGVVSLLAVHSDCLGIWTSHSVADDVTSNQDAGAEGRSPGHDDAVGEWSDVQGAGLVRDLTLCKTQKQKTQQLALRVLTDSSGSRGRNMLTCLAAETC